jgi:Tfp pilus assembly protein PilN
MADRVGRAAWAMRIPSLSASGLNLATKPAGGYRAFSALAFCAALALLVVTAWLVAGFLRIEGTPDQLLGQQRDLIAEQRRLDTLAAAASRQLGSESTSETLERTAFLNGLLVRKSVSWTRTFLDLEVVLPPNVRMLTIKPEVARGDTIRLDMTLGAKAPADFIGFLKTLEESDLFRAPALRGSLPPTDGDPTFRYQLTVEYDQQL